MTPLPDLTPAPAEEACLAVDAPLSPKQAAPKRSPLAAALCFLAVALLTCSYSLLLQAAKVKGAFPFAPVAVTAAAETLKLAIALASLRPGAEPPLKLGDCARAAVPALLYCAQNTLVYSAMVHLTPPQYQLLSNAKLAATAALSRLILKKLFSPTQWAGLAILLLSVMLPGIAAALHAPPVGLTGLTPRDLALGSALMALVALLSGLAGVLTERLLKHAPGSTMFKNAQLYAFGVLLYAPPVCRLSTRGGVLAGWNAWTLALVLNLALQGLAVSCLLRLASNIEKLFAGAAAYFASVLLSGALFGLAAGPVNAGGGLLLVLALLVYHRAELRG